jgi:hypothetical protein
VAAQVASAAERAGRPAHDVTVIAVAKTQPVAAIAEAVAAGVRDVGENYVQELLAKQQAQTFAPAPRWHFIGRLQRNKVRMLAGRVDLIHAVDSLELALEIGKRAAAPQPALVAVNLGGEQTKSGFTADALLASAAELAAVPNLRWCGLMTLPPPCDDAEQVRPVFAALAQLRRRLEDRLSLPLPLLSMGMSGDFEVAIAEGATHVRVGTAIFGARPAPDR